MMKKLVIKVVYLTVTTAQTQKILFLKQQAIGKKELLNEEFKSLGFFISDHPLNEFRTLFSQMNIVSYKDFMLNAKNEGLVSGTLMSIQEKKSSKGTPFAIAKFSDNSEEFELFLFSELLIKNRNILNEGESFILTFYKDLNANQRRINVKKIIALGDLMKQDYKEVLIEIDERLDLNDFNNLLIEKGETKIKLIMKQKNKKFTFDLENPRKFDLKLFNKVKSKEYVKKIIV